MKSSKQNPFLLTAIAAGLLVAFGSARAQDDDITQLTKPESTFDVGGGYVDTDNQRFGQYTGRTKEGGYGIVDFSLLKRDDSTGTWFSLTGRNLGYEDRELRLENKRQGNWGYFIDYSRIPRYDPFTVNTGLQGLGTTTQTPVTITPGTGSDYHLKTTRDRWTLGLEKAIGSGWDFQVRYRNEQKDGSRLWGQGTFTTWRFLTDVIDQTTQQIDALANYNTKRFQLTAGYYGTSFDNNNALVNVGGTALFPGSNQMALPPGNQSHQVYVTGGYNFTGTMRGDFKLAYAMATQDDLFPTSVSNPAVTRNNLDGRVDTTLLQGGLSGRATPKFSWRADLRYEDRDDKTPVELYWRSQIPPPAGTGAAGLAQTSTSGGVNEPRSIKTTTGKLVGNYALPMGIRLTGDVVYERKERSHPPVLSVDFRERTDEATYRVELRRAVAERVTGAVSYLHSDRNGSDWFPMVAYNGTTPTSALIAPLHLADRKRDTGRLTVNWIPTDPLSLNFRVDESRDNYSGRDLVPYDLGPKEGRASEYSIDAAYLFSDRVTGTAWYTRGDNRYEDATCRDTVPNQCDAGQNSTTLVEPVWSARLRNISDTFGVGLRAKLGVKWDIGADVTESKVRDEMQTAALSADPLGRVVPLDDIHTKITTVRLYGKYALNRHSGVRLDYIYDQYKTDDWTWANWRYPDGTTVLQDPNQNVNFVGVSYYYKFH